MIEFDFELSDTEMAEVQALPPAAWFTTVKFANALSPAHPNAETLEGANTRKQALVNDWIGKTVGGRTVLDTFAANGAFSFQAARLGATAVTGIEWDGDRVAAANLVASFMRTRDVGPQIEFYAGDVYSLADRFPTPFDVSLCLGGLYHVADPPHVLRQLRAVTKEFLVVQTSSIVKGKKNQAEFRVRGDGTKGGYTSIVRGSGKWYMTAACFREMLKHGGFEIIDERVSPPTYSALCRAVELT